MTVTVREGGFYTARNGEKVGPIRANKHMHQDPPWKWGSDSHLVCSWKDNGSQSVSRKDDLDLISEWSEAPSLPSPVRKVERWEIVPGVYGIFSVMLTHHNELELGLNFTRPTAVDIRNAISTLTAIAEALEAGNE